MMKSMENILSKYFLLTHVTIINTLESALRKIIGVAAPARSGKDTVASILLRHKDIIAYALADPLKIGCQVLFGLADEETWNDDAKEQAIPLWRGSPRFLFQQVGTEWMRELDPEHWLKRSERAFNSLGSQENSLVYSQLQDIKAPFKLAAKAFFGLSEQQTWSRDYYNIKDDFWNMTPRQMFDLLESLCIKNFPDYYEQRVQRDIALPTRDIPLFGESETIIIKDIRFENEAEFIRKHNGQIWHVVRHNAEKVNAHSSEFGIVFNEKDIIIDNNGTLEQLSMVVEKEWQKFTAKDADLINILA